jgi:glucose-1-phosphate cytidylyltransferase
MNIYSHYDINEFVVAIGYKGEVVKQYFYSFYALNNDITVDLGSGEVIIHKNGRPHNWRVHIVDTGLHTQTGGRLKRLQGWLAGDETFMFTYGDGVADIDLRALLRFHLAHGRLATVTTVRVPARFGRIAFDGDRIVEFFEKPETSEGWINGGFFVLNRGALDYIEGDETVWERDAVVRLARDGQLMGYRHNGFWSCMDTLKEKQMLEDLWASGAPPWRIWDRPAVAALR